MRLPTRAKDVPLREWKIRVGMRGPILKGRQNDHLHVQQNDQPSALTSVRLNDLNRSSREAVPIVGPSRARTPLPDPMVGLNGLNQEREAAKATSDVRRQEKLSYSSAFVTVSFCFSAPSLRS
jgi:hypothetical protein